MRSKTTGNFPNADYVNQFIRSFSKKRKLEDSVLKMHPVITNILPVGELENYITTQLESSDNKNYDNELKNIQEDFRNILGPITSIWRTMDQQNADATTGILNDEDRMTSEEVTGTGIGG